MGHFSIALQKTDFSLDIQVVVDQSFRQLFGEYTGTNSKLDRRVAATFCHAQAMWFGKESIGTSIRLDFRAHPTLLSPKTITFASMSGYKCVWPVLKNT